MNVLADIIASRVVDELLTVIKVRGYYGNWVEDSTDDYSDLYEKYQDNIKEVLDEATKEMKEAEEKKEKKKKSNKKTEAELIGEAASLMTQMGIHLQKEEFEKCAAIRKKIDEVKKTLWEEFKVNLDEGNEENE